MLSFSPFRHEFQVLIFHWTEFGRGEGGGGAESPTPNKPISCSTETRNDMNMANSDNKL